MSSKSSKNKRICGFSIITLSIYNGYLPIDKKNGGKQRIL